MNAVTYYPGCSLESTAQEYQQSMIETFHLLDMEPVELADWNCCGATSAHSIDEDLALKLPARNLAIASETTDRLIVPCAACYSRQKKAATTLEEDPALKNRIEKILDRSFQKAVAVENILDFLHKSVDLIRARVTRPLSGLRVVCYYGCLLTRPPKITGDGNYEDPQTMDDIVAALGATPIQWSFKTECCGASHSIARGDLVRTLVSKIVSMAREADAQVIITACPLCQMNLDIRQDAAEGEKPETIPAVYITELISAALGSSKVDKFFKGHFISPAQILT